MISGDLSLHRFCFLISCAVSFIKFTFLFKPLKIMWDPKWLLRVRSQRKAFQMKDEGWVGGGGGVGRGKGGVKIAT